MQTILFVEDDALIRNTFSMLLKTEGYEVRTAASGEAALLGDAARSASLILLDVGLPGMDGIECAGRLRQMKIRAPIVFITAFGGSEFVDRALACRPHAYMVKPISREQLLPLVRSALTAAETDRQEQARMQDALNDSRTISAAVGMLAERHGWTLEQAFNALRLMARSESRPIIDLAQELTSRPQ